LWFSIVMLVYQRISVQTCEYFYLSLSGDTNDHPKQPNYSPIKRWGLSVELPRIFQSQYVPLYIMNISPYPHILQLTKKPCHLWGLEHDFPLRILYWLGDSQGWVTRGWGWYIHSVEPAKSQQKIPKNLWWNPHIPPCLITKKKLF
jgi:hypothetical protein